MIPKLSEKSIENLILAALYLRTEHELLLSIPLKDLFSSELLQQMPQYTYGMCGTELKLRG